MKGAIIGATVGFVAPITVSVVSGVQWGTNEAGWFLASSWIIGVVMFCLGGMFEALWEETVVEE